MVATSASSTASTAAASASTRPTPTTATLRAPAIGRTAIGDRTSRTLTSTGSSVSSRSGSLASRSVTEARYAWLACSCGAQITQPVSEPPKRRLRTANAELAGVLAPQVHASAAFALLLRRLLLRTRRASAGPCFIRAAGRCADREPASRATGKREHGGDCKKDRPYRSHQGCGPLSALTFASLASRSAIRFCTRRMCHSSHSRRVSEASSKLPPIGRELGRQLLPQL